MLVIPVVVRKIDYQTQAAQQCYEIVANERTWFLAQRLGWHQIPCVVQELTDADAELIHRDQSVMAGKGRDDPIADAIALSERLRNEPGLSVSALAREIDWDRTELQHHLRLAALPPEVQLMVRCGHLSVSHARRLGSARLTDIQQIALAYEITKNKLTVRQLEIRLRNLGGVTQQAKGPELPSMSVRGSLELTFIERTMSELLGCPVHFHQGSITIDFFGSFAILDGILERLGYIDLPPFPRTDHIPD